MNTSAPQLADEDFDTVAGLVMKTLGRLPRRGEAVTLDGLELRVVRVDRRRIDLLRVTSPRDLPAPRVRGGLIRLHNVLLNSIPLLGGPAGPAGAGRRSPARAWPPPLRR